MVLLSNTPIQQLPKKDATCKTDAWTTQNVQREQVKLPFQYMLNTKPVATLLPKAYRQEVEQLLPETWLNPRESSH